MHDESTSQTLSEWLVAASTAELDDGDMKRLETVPPVALYRVEDDYYATADTCTHMEYSLSDGYLDEDRVECGLHMAQFCVRTGKALSLPATQDLDTYAVRIDGDAVLVDVIGRVVVPDTWERRAVG